MSLYIVTVSFEEREQILFHNPKNKKEGSCHFGEFCSDFTGRHHSILIESNDEIEEAKKNINIFLNNYFSFKLKYHITRIEKVIKYTLITDENNLSMKLNEILKSEPKCRFCKKILDSDLYCDVCRCYGIEKEFK